MAASLRHPLSWLVWLAMAVIYLPLLPASAMLFAPAFSLTNWQRLLNDPQLPQATIATLVSTLVATLGALLIALLLVSLLWPGQRWRRLTTRLPWLLAIPTWRSPPPRCCCLPKAACFIRSAPSVRLRLTAMASGWA